MIILGIETSCDDTAASVLKNKSIVSDTVKANRQILDIYGGVVPELSARMHQCYITSVVKQTLKKAKLTIQDIDLIAVTTGPGLLRSLLVGTTFAKTLALITQKPLMGINHLEGHVLSGHIHHNISFPFMCLLISGGHTMIVLAEKLGHYKILGQTIDDSAGEAFDKISQILKLKNIGGASVEQYAQQGTLDVFTLPRPMIHSGDLKFSFAGLKTAIKNLAQKLHPLSFQQQCDLCCAAQQAISDTLVKKINLALQQWQNTYPTTPITLVTVGGVASNKQIRRDLQNLCDKNYIRSIIPPMNLCTDNAAMIANVAYLRAQHTPELLQQSLAVTLNIKTLPTWPLNTL